MSEKIELVSYESLEKSMANIKTDIHPSELQGVAYGLVCLNDIKQAQNLWAKFLMDEFADILDDQAYIPFLDKMGQIFNGCESDLLLSDYGIYLCLPNDSASIAFRAKALSHWCKGFLFALGCAGKPQNLESPEIQEALLDLSSMINMEYEDEDDDESNERAYMELVEYIRLVPIMILQEQLLEKTEETIH